MGMKPLFLKEISLPFLHDFHMRRVVETLINIFCNNVYKHICRFQGFKNITDEVALINKSALLIKA